MFLQKITNLYLTIYENLRSNKYDEIKRTIFRKDISNDCYKNDKINFDGIWINMSNTRHTYFIQSCFTFEMELNGVVILSETFKLSQTSNIFFGKGFQIFYKEISDSDSVSITIEKISIFIKKIDLLFQNIKRFKNDLFKIPAEMSSQLQTLISIASDVLIPDILTIVNQYLNLPIQKGMIIDCLDSENKPYPALVLDIFDNSSHVCSPYVLVHYFGWKHKWNVLLNTDSYKLNMRHSFCESDYYFISHQISNYATLPLEVELISKLKSLGYNENLILIAANALKHQYNAGYLDVDDFRISEIPEESIILLMNQLDETGMLTTKTNNSLFRRQIATKND